MNILFVDDQPEYKVEPIIQYLKGKNIKFTSEIVKCSNEAKKFITENFENIDLIVLDLGLPMFKDGFGYAEKEGLNVIQLMLRKNITEIPVVIFSTTVLNDEECLRTYREKGFKIEHIYNFTGDNLLNFMAEN